MSSIANLGSGTGKLYRVAIAGNIDTFANTPEVMEALQADAVGARIIYTQNFALTAMNTEQFYSNVYGSQYYLNDSGAAPDGNIAGALNITDQVILDSKNSVQVIGVDSDGIATIVRRSRITIAGLYSTSIMSDFVVLKTITGDMLPGDIVMIVPRETGDLTTIEIRDNDASGGNIRLTDGKSILINSTDVIAAFIRTGDDNWREWTRPAENILTIANKTLSAGGGTYSIIDEDTTATQRIDSKRGLVLLAGGTTLTDPWIIRGESGDPSARSQGTILDIILTSPVITTPTDYLDIFGIIIPPIYTASNNFYVRAWFDDSSADEDDWAWKATMVVNQLISSQVIKDFGLGNSSTSVGIRNATNCSAASAKIYRTISHGEGTLGMLSLTGELTMAVTLAQNAGSKELINTLPATCKPGSSAVWKFICPVKNGSGEGIKNALVVVSGTTLIVYATAGNSLAVSDIIDLSPVKYIAEL